MRMRSHDLMQVFTETCACERTTFRFKTLGRSDDMFIVKGVSVFPLGVQATIAKSRPLLTGEFQIILDQPPPIDYAPRILVEVAGDVPTNKYDEIIVETKATIAREHNFSCVVGLVAQDTIATELSF
jgi:phenylacetate-coenzyme A ligase PaaK-like adenylate-forming protein